MYSKNMRSGLLRSVFGALALAALCGETLLALDPHRALTQYTRTIWTQAQGLPQDTVRSVAQTPDGYLWVGTQEGLARFDGYDFLNFTREHGELPNNTVGKLLATSDGALWIGTSAGLARYANGRFEKFTAPEGLSSGPVTSIAEGRAGVVWMICEGKLYRHDAAGFSMIPPKELAPAGLLQSVYEDGHQTVWVGGSSGLMKRSGSSFVKVLGARDLGGSFITSIIETADGLFAGGTRGIMLLRRDGTRRAYTTADGLPNNFVLALHQDHSGNLWVGTYGGLSRLEKDRFVSFPRDNQDDRDWVWSLYEDREYNLWVGMNGGLIRLRDDLFRNYGRDEGMPSDDPYVVHQDKHGVVWIGYHDSGLVALNGAARTRYTTRNGLPSNEIFAIRDTLSGDLLISTRQGLSRLSAGRFTNYSVVDESGRTAVYDAIEDRRGAIWAATARGIYRRNGRKWSTAVPESAGDAAYAVTLAEGLDGSIWAGTLSRGLWHIGSNGRDLRLYTRADGLAENQIRSLYQDADGTLWIGSFGGGLNAWRKGIVTQYRIVDGLPSDNVAHIQDDGRGYLWLSTSRGISRISKQELADFAAHRISRLHPDNYGLEDGLRSAQCAPASPSSGGGTQTSDGRLWFPTMHNLATIDPADATLPRQNVFPAPLHLLEVSADGRPLNIAQPGRLDPGTRRIEIRFVGISLGAPERILYSYRLDGLEKDWTPAGRHRVASYSPMPHGQYRFLVRASIPDGAVSETSWDFEVVPHFYERAWFICAGVLLLAAGIWAAYRARLTNVHDRLALVFEERARMAREIHDTLAQGFVGISAQLDVLAMELGRNPDSVRRHLNLARKMAQHSLTEARRSVMNLRAGELETSDLTSVLNAAAQRWVAGSSVAVHVDICDLRRRLPEDVEQNVLRIAQEAVTNTVKHARASSIRIQLRREDDTVRLRVEDDGCGFEPPVAFSVVGGHFGILGMRERAEKLRAQFSLESSPGAGTYVQVTIPLAVNGSLPR